VVILDIRTVGLPKQWVEEGQGSYTSFSSYRKYGWIVIVDRNNDSHDDTFIGRCFHIGDERYGY